MSSTRREWLQAARERLSRSEVEAAHLVAQVLLAEALRVSRVALLAHDDLPLAPAELAAAEAYLQRRLDGDSLAYTVGHVEFLDVDLRVSPAVLVPRNETELVVQRAAQALGGHIPASDVFRVVDVGTGSGAIALGLAKLIPAARVVAIDCSTDALRVAHLNRRRLGLSERVALVVGDGLAPLATPTPGNGQSVTEPHAAAAALQRVWGATGPWHGLVDLVVSNPPYVDPAEAPTLRREVLREPHVALFAGAPGAGGLAFHTRLLHEAPDWLRPGGWLVLELGHGQAEVLKQLVQRDPRWIAPAEITADWAGIERVLAVQRAAAY